MSGLVSAVIFTVEKTMTLLYGLIIALMLGLLGVAIPLLLDAFADNPPPVAEQPE